MLEDDELKQTIRAFFIEDKVLTKIFRIYYSHLPLRNTNLEVK